MQSRRKFIKVSALTAAGLSVIPSIGAQVLSVETNDKLRKKRLKSIKKYLLLIHIVIHRFRLFTEILKWALETMPETAAPGLTL